MKKLFLILILCFCAAPMVYAQNRAVFSSSLGGGAYTTRKTFYNPGAPASRAAARPATTVKKTVIKYSPPQVNITEAQTEKLEPLIKRIMSGKTKSIKLICFTRDYNHAYHRLSALQKLLLSYNPDFHIDYQYITGNAVLKSNDNTMEILEYW